MSIHAIGLEQRSQLLRVLYRGTEYYCRFPLDVFAVSINNNNEGAVRLSMSRPEKKE